MTLIMRPGYGGAAVSDPDAQAYLQAVEVADNQALEQGVQQAVNQFVIGCKADGIWSAIKASCILAGARTLSGALVPLVGTAPSQVGTAGGWNYVRTIGLTGNGTDNYLDSSRNNNADPQDSRHLSVYVTQTAIGGSRWLIGNRAITDAPSWINWRATNDFRVRASQTANSDFTTTDTQVGFKAVGRASSSDVLARYGGNSYLIARASSTPLNENIFVFSGSLSILPSTTRLAFYSIGESLDLARLDARVTTLITAIGAAIP